MSGSVQTADQSSFHPSNFAAHPGSSAAGLGVAAVALAGGVPSTPLGWVIFGLQAAMAVLAMLGK